MLYACNELFIVPQQQHNKYAASYKKRKLSGNKTASRNRRMRDAHPRVRPHRIIKTNL